MRREESPFCLGRYWLGQVPGSDRWYRFWYDAGLAEIRRRSLRTSEFEDAKIALAEIVLAEGTGKPEGPDKVTLVAVFLRYRTHADQLPSAGMARRTEWYLCNFMGNAATVAEFNRAKQKAFIKDLRQRGLAVGSIVSLMIRVKAAMRHATKDGDSEDAPDPLLTHAPNVISSPSEIARLLNEPEPAPRSWHPDLDMVATFINKTRPDNEPLRRFILLKIAFACRTQAALELGPFLLDTRYRLIRLNPPDRRQTNKYRPTLPVPGIFWPVLTSKAWSTAATFVHHHGKRIHDIYGRWNDNRDEIGLPAELIPHSLRHFMATELRHAHLRYGVPRVPEDERERWLGHRRTGMHEVYGHYEPDYLDAAKEAVNAILLALDEKLDRPYFRQSPAKSRGHGSAKTRPKLMTRNGKLE